MRIILADHHEQSLWALETLLKEQPEFDLVGEAVNAQDLLTLAEKQTPDLIMMDCGLPGAPIEDLIAKLHELESVPIVMVMSSEVEYGRLVLKAGANAFVSKADQPDWLLEKLHKYANSVSRKKEANRNIQP